MHPDDHTPNETTDAESLRAAYQAMSAEKTREAEANEWCEAFSIEPVDGDR